MAGRIKRRLTAQFLAHAQSIEERVVICPLCDRGIPDSEQESHHLVPKSKGGKDTLVIHRICHRQIHALFTESELARIYNTVDALRAHPEFASFVRWVASKPADFFERAAKSERIRKL